MLIIAIFSVLSISIKAQEIPPVLNISPADMKARYQNWALTQADNRIIFAGNTDGLLMYNGSEWQRVKIPFKGTVRVVHNWENKIFIGGYGEIAYITQEASGEVKYHSLKHLVTDKSLEKEEIWNITSTNDLVYFQSFSTIWVYDGNKFNKLMPPGNIMFIRKVGSRILVQVIDSGIYEISKENTFALLPGTEVLKDYLVSGILQHPDGSLLISTEKHGIFKYNNKLIKTWNSDFQGIYQSQQINRFIGLKNSLFAAGTIRNGVMITDSNGKVLYEINKKTALQNNTVLSLMEDQDGNLWAGLDKGISFIQIQSHHYQYPDIEGKLGTVYTAAEDKSGTLLLGTNQGIFVQKQQYSFGIKGYEKKDFELIPGSQGHVWQLLQTPYGILAGHNSGTYWIEDNRFEKISGVNGGYVTLPVSNDKKILLQGTYTGLITLEYKDGWKVKTRLKGLGQPVKAIVPDDYGNLWVCGPVSGIYKIKLNENYDTITEIREYDIQMGLANVLYPELVKINGIIYVKQESGYFEYNPQKDRFELSLKFKFNYPDYSLRSIDSQSYCKIYRDSFIIYRTDSQPVSYRLKIQKDNFSIAQLRNGRFLFCLDEGYAITNPGVIQFKDMNSIPLIIQNITSKSQTGINVHTINQPVTLRFDENSFTVNYYQPVFTHRVKFRTKLNGLDREWRNWTESTVAEFNNIGYGTYALQIQSNYNYEVKSLLVTISPPWYLSRWAYIIYGVILVLFVKILSDYLRYRIKKTEEKLKKENERLVREHKIALENQQLQAANISKSKELANTTIHLVKKNELLQEIKNELNQSRKNAEGGLSGKEYQKLMHLINENLTAQEDRQLFESNFNEVHESFMKNLKVQYPQLTRDDLILASYLKMNLSTKEIAPIFNLSVRGLENKRYRLRKKLGLTTESNLYEFFSGLDQ